MKKPITTEQRMERNTRVDRSWFRDIGGWFRSGSVTDHWIRDETQLKKDVEAGMPKSAVTVVKAYEETATDNTPIFSGVDYGVERDYFSGHEIVAQDFVWTASAVEARHKERERNLSRFTEAVDQITTDAIRIYPGAVNYFTGIGGDFVDYAMGTHREIAAPTQLQVLCAGLPKMVEADSFRGTLLDSNVAVWEETKAMSFCLYRAYLDLMISGDYVAYHVECDRDIETWGGLRNVFTVGFRMRSRGWTHDQTRGKKNAIPKDVKLNGFVDRIVAELNGVRCC